MDKENGETADRGEKSGSAAGAPADAASLLDAASLFGHSLFGGIPGGFGNHIGGHPLSGAAAFAMMGGRSGSSSGYGSPHHPPTTAPGSYGSLGTLSVAASQAASLGINPASAAWWTMASHLAAQDYLARLQASAAASGIPFAGLSGTEGLVPGYPLLPTPHGQAHVSTSKSGSKSVSGSKTTTTSSSLSSLSSVTANIPTASLSSHSSHSHHRDRERDREREQRDRERDERDRERERDRDRERERQISPIVSSASAHPSPSIISDPASILGGVRLPPDTEIIKYTSSIVGPKIPGTTNRGRKKTISLDPPSVSVMAAHSSTGLLIERGGRRFPRSRLHEPPDYRDSPVSGSQERDRDRVELIKLPAHSSNGTIPLNIPAFASSTPETEAPLNLSLKPHQSSSMSSTGSSSAQQSSLSSLSSLSASLGTPAMTPGVTERTSRRKPGPKPRRVIQSPSPVIPASPSPSLAQLFAAADSPRPSSGSEENDSQAKESRPRNLGRGTSKPKKNTVASLLAQSRALGIKPSAGLEVSPLNHQVSLLKSNILGNQQSPPQSQHLPATNKVILLPLEWEPGDGEEHPAGTSEDGEKERPVSPNAPSDDSKADTNKHKKHLVSCRSDGDNKLKIRAVEGLSEDSSAPDISSDSVSGSEEGFPSDSEDGGEMSEGGIKREGEDGPGPMAKRRKLEVDERELRIPLEHGWRRETLINGVSRTGVVKGEVTYYSPCGRRFKQYPDVVRFLEKNNIVDMNRENFSFSSRVLLGDFLQPTVGEDYVRLSEEQVMKRLLELRMSRSFKSRSGSHRPEGTKMAQEQRLQQQLEREKVAMAAKEAKRVAKEEAARQKEHVRLLKEQERTERQEAIRREREQRNQQMMEGRKRLAFTLEQKMHIIREIESGKSKSDVSRELGLASSTVATIWKNRDGVLTAYENNVPVVTKNENLSHEATPSSSPNKDDMLLMQMQETARRRRQEELEKQRQEEQLRKQQERELKRQQAVLIKEQLYMQELNKQREMLYTVELERERRRQHMVLVKALEARKRLEERERKRQEVRAEKMASKERRMEQRRIELELVRELRKPVEDMEISDHKSLPTLNRIPGLKLPGQAFADTLMVFEFLHNFGETLGFDMESLPSLNSLQMALLNDEEAEEELLSVMTHLLVCAIEDPGIPNPARHTTILGQSLKQADITHSNLSEILRIYLYANATGEVKALTGIHFERDREKKSDHHNTYGEVQPPCGKNAAFFEHLHDNPTWRMSEWLHERPFLALSPTHKASILAFLCNELLQNKAVIRQIDNSIETVGQLRKDRWILDTKIRKLRMLHGRKIRQVVPVLPNKLENSGCEESSDISGVEGKVKLGEDVDDDNDDDAEDAESGNESEGTQPEEDEDKNLTAEELNRKMERLMRQSENSLQALSMSAQQLRANCFGQDRWWRRYWTLPCAGGVFVEAMESAEPDVYSDCEENNGQVTLKQPFSEGTKPEKEEKEDKEITKKSESLKECADEEQKMNCEERLKHTVKLCVKETEDEELEMEVEELDAAQKEDVKIAGDSEECGEVKNEHRKKRTREKEDCMDRGVGTDELSSWERNEERARLVGAEKMERIEEFAGEDKMEVDCDKLQGEGERVVNERTGKEEVLVTVEKEAEDITAGEPKCNAKGQSEETCDVVIRREEEKTGVNKLGMEVEEVSSYTKRPLVTEESAVKCEENIITEITDGKIKIEGDVICVPSGLTVTKADMKDATGTSCIKNEVKDDGLSAVKVEIKSDLFSTELNAIKKEDKSIGTMCVDSKDKNLVFGSKTQLEDGEDRIPATFLVHRPIQFERLGECMEKANAEIGPVIVPNGDKFNALNHLYNLNSSTVFSNGKELNGTFLLSGTTGILTGERNWFSVLPRDACDSTSVTNGTCPTRCVENGTELRIPVFPPPSRLSSPSPGGSQCESPAPLILTPEEMVQLEQLKRMGPMEPAEAKPVPCELRRGWWRITDEDQLRTILENLHSRGVRERELKRILSKYIEHAVECSGKLCVASGNKSATDLAITDMDHKISALPGGAPLKDTYSDWFPDVALRVDVMMLEQVEALEDKVANASMQVKGWKVPGRATTEEGVSFRPSCMPAEREYMNTKNPIGLAKDRLMSLEAAIERRYLKPPLGVSTGDVNLSGMSGEVATTEDNVPKGLVVWREAVGRAHTSAQLAMALYMLEASIAWDKSIMKAVSSVSSASGKGSSNCQFCHSGDNEDKLLLCDGCDKGYHTYCFKPKMENIPDGDWYCYECMNKATGERNCIVCGKKVGKNLVMCDLCPRAYHTDCLQPPLAKVPRGKWYCPTCQAKQPKKRGSGRRSTTHPKSKDAENSDQPLPATSPATPATLADDSNSAATTGAVSPSVPPPAPTTPNRKERGKKISKDLNPCRILLEDLESHDEAWPFLLPVNTKQFPTYRKIIKTPMDLSTIKKKLQDAQYKSREEFCADVRLIFNNCETFNEDDSPVGKAGHSMRSFFETRWGELNGSHPKAIITPPS